MQLRGPQIPSPHPLRGRHHSDIFLPSAWTRMNLSRAQRLENITGLVSGQESAFLFPLVAGDVVSFISFTTQATLATSPTTQIFTLRNSAASPALLASTADDGATAWAANTEKRLYVSRKVTDAVATSGSAVITSATAAFTAADVGKNVTFMGAGAAGVPLGTTAARVTISTVDSATQATLSTTASTSVASNGTLYIATPYTVTADGAGYAGILVAAGGTMLSLLGNTLTNNSTVSALSPAVGWLDSAHAGLTTPETTATQSSVQAVIPIVGIG